MVPDVETLLELEPEELGAHLLLAIGQHLAQPGNSKVHLVNDLLALTKRTLGLPPNRDRIARDEEQVERAMIEAWSWLEAQGLLVPPDKTNAGYGWRVPSRRAERLTSVAEFVPYAVARRLDREILDPRIRRDVWGCFVRGQFDLAAFAAMRAVEVAVREACDYGADAIGRPMMAKAFNPNTGPLTDMTAEFPEREAMRELFSGAMGLLKNPASHRKAGPESAEEAVEVAMIANHLLRIVARRKAAQLKPGCE